MKRLSDTEIRKIQEMKNDANLAGLLMMYPPKGNNDKAKDGEETRTEVKRV